MYEANDPPGARRRRALLGALLLLAAGCGGRGSTPPAPASFDAQGRPTRAVPVPASPPNLVLVVIDTLRADALGPAGEAGAPMPFLASLAARGASFTNAVAPAPWTLPSMASLLTGLLPSEHGLTVMHTRRTLAAAIPTFAEVLRSAYGYQTAAFVDGVWFQGDCETVLQGFAHRETTFALQGTKDRVPPWAEARDPGRPFFLLLHTNEAHAPYGAANHPWPPGETLPREVDPALLRPDADPAEIYRLCALDEAAGRGFQKALGPAALGRIVQGYEHRGFARRPDERLAADLAAAYWTGVRWVDGLLREAVGTLERAGLLENTLLVVTGDHGESFGEHGTLGHGRQLYDEMLRVPLVVVGPAPFQGGRVLEGSVGFLDVLPTYFDLAGLAWPADLEGRSALPLFADPGRCRPVRSEERLSVENTGEDVEVLRTSVRTPKAKHVVTRDLRTGEVREEAYDLAADPGERHDLATPDGRLPVDLPLDPCVRSP